MGWAKGSRLMEPLIQIIYDNVGDPDKRFYMYLEMIQEFADMDCDTLQECLGNDPEYDRAYMSYYGDGEEDE